MYDASGSITTGGVAQLVLPRRQSCSLLYIANSSSNPLLFEFGGARATAVLTSGVVTSVNITNSGFGYKNPPIVRFYGGGNAGNSSYAGLGLPGGAAPNNQLGTTTGGYAAPAYAVASLSGGSVSAITLVEGPNGTSVGGAGYVTAPYVYLENSDLDPYGCATPSATVGYYLAASGGGVWWYGESCTTDQISVFGSTTGQTFCVKWME
jgi:hypothetical protein